MSAAVDLVWRERAVLGEGPLWDHRDSSLTWLDIKGRRLHRLEAAGGCRSWTTPGLLACIGLDADGLVGACDRSLVGLHLSEAEALTATRLTAAPSAPPQVRFNDGKMAPDGAFWVGTMDNNEAEDLGEWLRFTADGLVSVIDRGYKVTNGPTFDAQRQRGFVTDSARQTIFGLDGWGASACASKRALRTFGSEHGYPDGMTLDSDGRLWIAFWDGGCVRVIDPVRGDILEEIALPVSRPTSCVFGGADLSTLFVTSASIGVGEDEALAGSLFAITGLSARGRESALFG